jgi:hypothetical protein
VPATEDFGHPTDSQRPHDGRATRPRLPTT